jgi:hypothetical protein
MENKKFNLIPRALVLGAIIILFIFGAYRAFFKDFIKSGAGDLLSQLSIGELKKNFSAPGGLIAKHIRSDSILTKAGVFLYTNVERRNALLLEFSSSPGLDAVAAGRVSDMFSKQYFEHEYPGGKTASDLAETGGYEYISIGENIAMGDFEDDQDLVNAWMNSPGHRANILNKSFSELGVAVGKGSFKGEETWIAVQIFGRPLSSCPSVDKNLEGKIEANTEMIDSLKAELEKTQSEIDSMDRRGSDREMYNQKVSEHNALVVEINGLIDALKADISIFNQQVRKFNDCIKN